MAKWRYQDQMLFLHEFVNQDRPRLTSIDEISDKEEEEDSCKEIHEKNSHEHAELLLLLFKIMTRIFLKIIMNLKQILKQCLLIKKN